MSLFSRVSAVAASLVIGAGCTTQYGAFVPKSEFAFPNSNVKMIASTPTVAASKSKTSFFIPPKITVEDVKSVYEEALKKADGANILINYHEDTSFTSYPILIYTIKYSIEGTPAQMDVGKKDIGK